MGAVTVQTCLNRYHISKFADSKSNTLLFAAIFCNILAGLFNSVRGFIKNDDTSSSNQGI